MTKKQIIKNLCEAAFWISEVALTDGEDENGMPVYEEHVLDMIDAIDKAVEILAKLKERKKNGKK